jgi:agmatine/peptidylarginine deiminase
LQHTPQTTAMKKFTICLLWLILLFLSGQLSAQPQNPYPVPEFDPSQYVIIRYPFNSSIWPLYSELIRECQESALTVLLVNNENELQTLRANITSAGIPLNNILFLTIPASRMWVRDHGPLSVRTDNGKAFIDFIDYNNSSHQDQILPLSLANHWGYDHYPINWIFDGGNFMVDSHKRLFTTTRLYSHNPGILPAQINQDLQQYMGITEIITVSPQHNDYWGHIDMQMKLLNDTTIVISSVAINSGPNYNILENNAQIIASLTAPSGRPYHIARLPKAENWKTYANALLLKDKLIVPIYDHPNDEIALNTYRQLLPNHTVVGINCNSIIQWGGAIHCITMQVYADEDELAELLIHATGNGQVMVNNKDYYDPKLFVKGMNVKLEAVPGSASVFEGWQGDFTGLQNPVEIIMDEDKAITAVFSRPIQNYALFRPDRMATYSSSDNGSITFSRVDNTAESQSGKSAWFSRFINPLADDYGCYSIDGLSVAGKEVFFDDNGDNLIINNNNDTIRIRTTASAGNTWTAYQDNDLIVTATVKSIVQAQVLGQTEPHKIIQFKTFDPQMQPVSHYLNNREISLSRSHGLVTAFNFMMFPDVEDHYSLSGMTDPEVGIQNLTWENVHDFQPGDVLHFEEEITQHNETLIKQFRITYLEREDMADIIRYRIKREINIISETEELQHDTISVEVSRMNEVFDKLSYMPYNHRTELIEYHSQSTFLEIESKFIETALVFVDCWSPINTAFGYHFYIKGLGGPYYRSSGVWWLFRRTLVYYNKNGQTWGNPFPPLAVQNQYKPEIAVFPNPSKGIFNISLPQDINSAIFELYDTSGRLVSSQEIKARTTITTTGLIGLYFYLIKDHKAVLQSGKIVIH